MPFHRDRQVQNYTQWYHSVSHMDVPFFSMYFFKVLFLLLLSKSPSHSFLLDILKMNESQLLIFVKKNCYLTATQSSAFLQSTCMFCMQILFVFALLLGKHYQYITNKCILTSCLLNFLRISGAPGCPKDDNDFMHKDGIGVAVHQR